MVDPTRWVVAILSAAWLVACGSGGPKGTGGPGSAAGTSRSSEKVYTVADQCAGLSESEAGALLGIPASDVQKKVLGEAMDSACSVASSAHPLGDRLSFALDRSDSVSAAEAAFERRKGDFATTVTPEAVAGLGDAAVWFGRHEPVVLDRLLVRKGNVVLDVISAPNGLDGAKKVAQAVLGKLK
jgi:hypothetical protein